MFPVAALVLGLFGSLHCVGMCGPIALALPLRRDNAWAMNAGMLRYHAGRSFTYAALGLLSGLAGSAVSWAGGQQTLSLVAGGLILLVSIAGIFGRRIEMSRTFSRPFAFVRNKLARFFGNPRPGAQFSIGLLNGLLPCGLVYAALAGASATGNAASGALFMFLFGIGTVPALYALSLAGNRISDLWRGRLRKAVPVFVAIMALLLVLRGLGLGIPYISPKFEKEGTVACCHCHRK